MKVPKARKLKSGTWFIQLRLNGESIPVTATTEKECTRQAQFVKAEYIAGKREQKGKTEEPPSPTVAEAIDAYISSRSNIISPSTIQGYDKIRRTRFQSIMSREISSITPQEWAQIVNDEAKEVKAKTLLNSWALVRSAIKFKTGEAVPPVKLPQIVPNERPFLDPEQIQTFRRAIHGSEYEIPLLLALSSLRQSEILGLQWEQVDLKKRLINIRGSVVYIKGELVSKPENKNKSSTRIVPILMDELYSALKAAEKPTGPVTACPPWATRKYLLSVCTANNLPPISIHCLRHSFASLAYHLGVPEKVTMEIGGWDDDHTMRKIYTHVARQDVSHYTDTLSAFFRQENANKNAN